MNNSLFSIIIPAYNEEKNISKVLLKLKKISIKYNFEIIVVDDGSKDKTSQVARKYTDKVITLTKNKGKGGAFIEGIKKANGKYVIQIDADDQFQVSDIPKFVEKLDEGFEVVLGTRFDNGEIEKGSVSTVNLFGNWLMTQTTIFFSGIKVTDIMAGFKAFHTKALRKLDLQTNHFGYEAEVIVKAGKLNLKVAEVPIIYKKRIFGKSSVNAIKDGLKIVTTIALMYFTFPGQPFGQGVVGKKIVKLSMALWMIIIIPLTSSLNSYSLNETIIRATIALALLLTITFYVRSKTAAYIISAFAALPISNFNPQISSLAYYSILSITPLFLMYILPLQKNILLLTSAAGILIGIPAIGFLPSSYYISIYVLTLCYVGLRRLEANVTFLYFPGILLSIGGIITQNSAMMHFGGAISVGVITSSLILFLISFHYSDKPLFSVNRVIPLLFLFLLVLFLYISNSR